MPSRTTHTTDPSAGLTESEMNEALGLHIRDGYTMRDAIAMITATLPRILNKHTHSIPAGAVYIGRGSPWGNPFVIGRDGNRAEVIAKYEAWIRYYVAPATTGK